MSAPAERGPQPLIQVGPYVLERRLGHGGMGAVFRAYDSRLDRGVAVKRILPKSEQSPRARQRLRREARAAASLSHPSIVQVFDLVETDDGDWIVMELIEGSTLHDLLADGPLPLPEVLHVGRQVAEGLAAAHAKGIVHRDLKAENVMIGPDGQAKILDFGLAKHLWRDSSLSLEGTILGTSRSMSPEQTRGKTLSHRSDLFSLGVLLYEMVTGTSPFQGTDFQDTLERVRRRPHQPAVELRPEVPEALSHLIDRLLEKDPAARSRSAGEVATTLGRLAGWPLALTDSHNAPLPFDLDLESRRHREERRSWRRVWLRRVEWTAVGLLALAVLVLAIYAARRLMEKPAAVPARPSIAVLGFANQSRDPELGWLSTALSEMFSIELAASEELRLIPGESIARMKRELAVADDELSREALEQVRRNLGTDYVVMGSYVEPSESELRLQARLQDTRQGTTVVAVSQTGSQSDLFDLISRVAAELRQTLDWRELSPDERQSLRAAISTHPEAYRLYAEALDQLRAYKALAARNLLEKVVEIDPQWARGHDALSRAWSALGYDREARASAVRASQLTEGLPREEVLWIEGHDHQIAGEWPEAISTYSSLWRFFPDDVDYGLRLADVQVRAGRPREALATLEALRRVPPPAGEDPRIDLSEAEAAFLLDDYERELAAAQRAVAKAQAGSAWTLMAEGRRLEGRAFYHLARLAEAQDALSEARRLFAAVDDRGKVAQVLDSYAQVEQWRGRLDTAEGLYREALEIHRATGNRKGQAATLDHLAYNLVEMGELGAARSGAEEAVAAARELADRSQEVIYLDGLVWIVFLQGDLASARALAEEYLVLAREVESPVSEAWSQVYLGRIAFEQGDLAGARAHHEDARRLAEANGSDWLLGYALFGLGMVSRAAGDPGAAEAQWAAAAAARERVGEEEGLAESHLGAIELDLDRGRFAAAESKARAAMDELAAGQRRDFEATAGALLVEALVAQGRLAEARRACDAVSGHGLVTRNARVRAAVTIAAARLAAAEGDRAAAERALGALVAETAGRQQTALELEARLALAEVTGTAGEGLAERARVLGFERVARAAG